MYDTTPPPWVPWLTVGTVGAGPGNSRAQACKGEVEVGERHRGGGCKPIVKKNTMFSYHCDGPPPET